MDKEQLLARAFSLCDEIEQRQSQLRDILCLLISAESPSQPQPQPSGYMPDTAPTVEVAQNDPVSALMAEAPETPTPDPVEEPLESGSEPIAESTPSVASVIPEIVTESTPLQKSQSHKVDLRKALTINDRFRFRRELFAGDEQAMTNLLARLSECESANDACGVVSSLGWDMDSEAVIEFIEFVRNNFNAYRS